MSETRLPPFYFDMATGEEAAQDQRFDQACFLIDRLAIAAEIHPRWRSDAGAAVRLDVRERAEGKARVAIAAGDWRGELSLSVDDAGWVRAGFNAENSIIFSAFLHRPYEEIELLTAPESADASAGPAGRMGKRMNWISLSTAAWPALADIAPGQWFNAEAEERQP